tara:strand:+ start:3009 stop:6878 length:3870 start_codon:yes stop_codon:yes gene_type:complete
VSSLFTIDSNDFAGTQWQVSDGPDTDFADNMSAGYDRFSRAMSITMIQENYVAELAPIVDQVKDATGERLMNPGGMLEYIQGRTGGWNEYEEKLTLLRERAEPLGIQVPDREEIERRIKQRLPQIEARYFDTTNRQTTGGFWGELLGSAAAELKSAVTGPAELLPGLVIGASYKFGLKALARAGLIDGLASAGVVGYTQPAVAAMREKYGLKYDFNDFVAATGGAFVGGAGFRVVGQGGFDASRAIGDKINPARAIGREMLETVDRLSPEQMADAFRVMSDNGLNVPEQARGALNELEREVDLAANSPFKDSDMDAQNENAQRVAAETINLINEGQPRIDLPPTTREVAELDVHHYDNLDGEIYRFDPAEIEVDAKTFQFKSGIDERGIVSGHRLEKETRWDPALSGTITVYEYANGRRFIADGHQRLGLAQRILENDPSQEIKIYGRLIKETDGHTPQDAMIDASLVNIANTPLGDERMIIDAAKVMRIRPEALKAKLPPRSQFVRRIYDLVELSDESFQLVVNELVRTDYAAIVGRLVRDKDKHMALLRVLKDTDPSNLTQAEAIVRQAMDAEFTVATQDTLFGEEMLVESLFKERAKVLDETIKILRKDRAVFNSLVQNEKRIEAGGNTLSTDQNAAKAQTDGQAIQTLQITANRKGPLSDALTEAAKRFKETGRAAPAARDFADAVRGGIERGDLDGIPERGEIIDVDAPPQIDSIAASHVERLDSFAEPGGKGYEAQSDMLERELVESIAARPSDEDLIARGEIAPDYRYYLEPTSDSIDVPIQDIVPIRRRPDGVANAKVFMAEAALGDKAKRGPLSVKDNGDGTYTLLDGNSTYAIADEAGMPELPARVLTDQEFAAEVAQKNAQKILEMGPDAKKKRLVLAQDLTEAELENLASILQSRQAYASIDDIMTRNEAFNVELNAAVQKAAGEHEVDYVAGPIKERDRVEAKINDKYVGELNRIADVSRATITVTRPDEATAFIKELSKSYHVVDEGFRGISSSRYFDKKLMVINKDGVIGEVLIIERALYDAKHAQGGHQLYEISRGDPDTPAIIAELPDPEMRARLAPLSGDELIQAANREMVQLYNAARNQMGSEFSEIADSVLGSIPATASRVSNSEAVSSGVRVSDMSSRADISDQASRVLDQENALPSSRSTAGYLPSSEKNLIDETSTINLAQAQQIASEITDAGEQMLMEGVEAITGAQRAQAAVDAPMTGGDAPMDIGLFDTAARAQSDLLDMMIPTGRFLEDAQGKQIPEMRRVEDELREIEQDASMLNRLKDCA